MGAEGNPPDLVGRLNAITTAPRHLTPSEALARATVAHNLGLAAPSALVARGGLV